MSTKGRWMAAGAALALAVAGTVVNARMGGGFGPGAGYGMGGGYGMGTHMGFGGGPGVGFANAQAHLDNLRATLNITASQESAWNAFANAVEQQAQVRQTRFEQLRANPPQTAPDRMALRNQMLQQNLAGHEAVQNALNGLYAVLTPEQRAILDRAGPGSFCN